MPRYRAIPRARVNDLRHVPDVVAEPPPVEEPEVDYRSLQEQAKAAGIPANQSREDLEKALSDE